MGFERLHCIPQKINVIRSAENLHGHNGAAKHMHWDVADWRRQLHKAASCGCIDRSVIADVIPDALREVSFHAVLALRQIRRLSTRSLDGLSLEGPKYGIPQSISVVQSLRRP